MNSSLDGLVAESAWVRKLALAVARDAHAAEDLAQDAWLASLSRPPRDESRRRGWFARVIGNLDRLRARGDVNRLARERAARRDEPEEDPALALERVEMQEALLHSVRALAEPYRTTVVLRYFEGLAPAEVGRRTQVPLRTVHTRTTRALALLREALDRKSGGDRSRWMSAWIPLLAVRPARDGIVPWILATNTQLKAVVALAAGILVIVAIRRANAPEPVPPRDVATSPALADEDVHEVAHPLWPGPRVPAADPRVAGDPDQALAAGPAALAADPCAAPSADLARPSPPLTIEGFVRRSDSGRGGSAWLRRRPDPPPSTTPCAKDDASEADARTSFGSDGAFRFENLVPGSYCVGVELENGVARVRTCDVADGVPTSRLFFSAGSGEVRGRASGPDGAPIAGELVVLERHDGRWWPEGEIATTRTDTAGNFRFPSRCPGKYYVSLRGGAGEAEPGDVFGLELAPGETKKVEFGPGGGRSPWTARVLGPDGWPVAVVPELTLESLDTGLLQGVRRPGDGTVRAELLPGRYAVLALLLDERRRIAEFRIPSRELEAEIKLPPTSVLVRATPRLPSKRSAFFVVSLRAKGSGHGAMGLPDAEGWHFFGVPPGEYEIHAITSPVPREREDDDFGTLDVRPGDRELSIEIHPDR